VLLLGALVMLWLRSAHSSATDAQAALYVTGVLALVCAVIGTVAGTNAARHQNAQSERAQA
jgi:hypothetical protein